jgi:hypothetical protein
MALAVLYAIELSKYRESLEPSLETAILSSSDLRKQFTTIRETPYHDGKPTSFGMIVRVLGVIKAIITEHRSRYPAQ